MKSQPVAQQFRRSTGEFLNKQTGAHINQTQLNEKIKMLAAFPGRHQGNAARQDLASAALNLISFLSILQPEQALLPIQNLTSGGRSQLTSSHAGAVEPVVGKIKSVTPYALYSPLPGPVTAYKIDSLAPPDANLPRVSRTVRAAPSPVSTPNSDTPAFASISLIDDKNEFSQQEISAVRYHVQNNLLDKLLADNNHSVSGIHSSITRVNALIDYINGNQEERIDTVARLLLSASGAYGENKDESLSDGQKHAIIAHYLNQAILGESFDSWCLQQAWLMRKEDNELYNYGNLQNRLSRALNADFGTGRLSTPARLFYQNESLKKLLPLSMLELDEADKAELEKLTINDPRWAFIHAGAMLLSSSGADFVKLSLKDLEEVGMILDVLLRKGAVPQEYIEFFKIPALFDYITYSKVVAEETPDDLDKLPQIFEDFFAHIGAWAKVNNPLALLPDLLDAWKTRRELASEMLSRHGISEDLLNHYLDSHDEIDLPVKHGFVRKILPNIDKVFQQQNEKIELTTRKVDEILLPHVFNSLDTEDQEFIETAKIERVSALFDARDQIRNVPLPPSARRGMAASGALVFHIPDHIDLLSCTQGDKERIYALKSLKSGEYYIERVDRNREAMLDLLEDDFTPRFDKDYKLKITSHTLLKRSSEPAKKLIDALTDLHSKKIRKGLDAKGYDKTTKDKVAEFFFGLIPFYTCINESVKGNTEKAVPACLADILWILPVAGLAAKTGIRFGTALSRATIVAVNYGLREATVNAMLRQAGRQLVNQFPLIAKEISPRVMQNLGVAFLRSLDPGIELLSRAGIKGVTALKTIAQSSAKSKGLSLLSTALDKISLPETKLSSFTTVSLFSPQSRHFLEVANAGMQKGVPLWVQVNRETGEFFEQKFRLAPDGNIYPITSPLTERLDLLKHNSIRLGMNLMNPGEPQPSGSRQAQGMPQTEIVIYMPGYNEMPPLAGNSEKFNIVRKIINAPYPPTMPGVVNTEIQRLEKFIPVYPLFVINPVICSQMLAEYISNLIRSQPWRAFPGFALNVPPHIAWVQPKIRANLLKSMRMFHKADNILATIDYTRLLEHRVGKYFAGMLGTERIEVIEEAVRRFAEIVSNSKNLIQASKDVDFSNIITISTDLVRSPDDPTQYITTLTQEELYSLPLGLTHVPDSEGRIMFFADAFLERPAVLQPDNFAVNSRTKLTPAETFLHEFTHASSRTADVFKVYIATKREKLNGEQLRASFIRELYYKEPGSNTPSIFNRNDFRFYIDLLCQVQGISVPITKSSIIKAIMSDSMLFANLIMLDADVIARTITALVNNRPFNAKYIFKRDTANVTELADESIDAAEDEEISQAIMSLILKQVSKEMMTKENAPTASQEKKTDSPQLKKVKINGVTMNIQLYGDAQEEDLLFPEINEIIPEPARLNVKQYRAAFASLLPAQRKALKTWANKKAIHTRSYSDATPGLVGGINPKLNKDLLKGHALHGKEKNIYQNTMAAFSSKKIPPARRDYIRGSCYINGTYNPWLEDGIEINDYVTTYPAFMSVSTDPTPLLNTIIDSGDIDNHIDSLLFFKIENATRAMPLLPAAAANSPLKNEYLYPPGALFKVKSLVYSNAAATEIAYGNQEIYLLNRVGAVLEEVDEEEAKSVSTAKNIFTGEEVYF